MLPKRGMTRRLMGMSAGGGNLTESINSQDCSSSPGLSNGTCKTSRHTLPIPADRVEALPSLLQVTPLPPPSTQQKTPAQVTAGPSRKESRLTIYDQRRQRHQPANRCRSARNGGRQQDPVHYTELEGGKQTESNPDWARDGGKPGSMGARTDRVRKQDADCSLPGSGKCPAEEQDRQVALLELSLQSTVCVSTPPLPRLCDASCNAPRAVAAEDNQAADHGRWGVG